MGSLSGFAGTEMRPGVAIITTSSGEVEFFESSGEKTAAGLHQIREMEGVTIRTGADGLLFLALSNGTALALDANSELHIESYTQGPFESGRESLEFEPSHSDLILDLKIGSLYYESRRLSPLSTFVARLPTGELHAQKAWGRLAQDGAGTHVTLAEGIVTFTYPGNFDEEFISGPDRRRISKLSAANGRIAETVAPANDSFRERTNKMIAATQHANRRVVFRSKGGGPSIPQPILVSRPDDQSAPPSRPYRYID